MKATIDIPDDLYRSVKARSALEGRALRSVAIELFQGWLAQDSGPALSTQPPEADEQLAKYPWLAYARKHVTSATSHAMTDIRESIARGWAEDTATPTAPPPGRR